MSERNAIEDAIAHGIDLSMNAFMLVHGWTAGAVLLEFVARFLEPLEREAMSAAELATNTETEEGPVAIVLRTCCILGYTELDKETCRYSLVCGTELDELRRLLGPGSQIADGIRELYAGVSPPFAIPSDDAGQCLALWDEQRPTWSSSRSRGLSILLDGVVLAPLLTSVTYNAKWDEEGHVRNKGGTLDRIDFSKVNSAMRTALGDIFEQLGVGTMNAKGIITMSSKGTMALQRCYSFYVPVSYAPLIAQFPQILAEDASWGFAESGEDAFEMEEHVDRILNVVGSGAQHRTLFKDLIQHVDAFFRGDAFGSQPSFIVDTGCGDGSLLVHIYQHVKENTPRGKVLKEYPLMMVGVDLNEEPRVNTAVSLSRASIPHLVISGDVGKPAEMVQTLRKKKVDPSKTLHVRSFLDHDRPFIPPVMRFQEDSAAARFARAQLADFVHLDRYGKPIPALDMFANLVEHFRRWADVLEVSFGLCMLEVMMLDVPTTKRFFNDCVSFPLDIVQCLSRQYMVSGAAFAMCAAMAGLLPSDFRGVETYPEQGRYHRMISQHLTRRAYSLRLAELSDLEGLLGLEELAWPAPMRAGPEVLRARLEASPDTNLVCELEGRVVGVLYAQRIEHVGVLTGSRFTELSRLHSPSGRLMQLIALAVHPECAGRNIGNELKDFALLLARLDSGVDQVVAVTRCSKEFLEFDGSMKEYVQEHFEGKRIDMTLDLHSSSGAQFVQVLDGFRPEDLDNQGLGVLLEYDPKTALPRRPSLRSEGQPASQVPTLELLQGIMTEVGYPPNLSDTTKGFFDYGMDSLELVRVRNKLGVALNMDLAVTLLLDFPTVHDLVEHLDKDRRVSEKPVSAEESGQLAASVTWDSMDATELLEVWRRILAAYGQAAVQSKFKALAQRCYPDMLRYTVCLDFILVDVEGPILQDMGLIQGISFEEVQKGRGQLMKHMMKHWLSHPEIRSIHSQCVHLSLQDQVWS